MAKVTLKLDTRKNRQKKDGTYPLTLELSHKSTPTRIGLKYSFTKEQWDDAEQTPIDIPNAKHIGAKIRSQLSKAELLLHSLKMELETMSVQELKARVKTEIFSKDSTSNKTKEIYVQRIINKESLTERAKAKIARMHEAKRFGNKSAVKTAYNALKGYFGFKPEDEHENILFVDVDYNTLENFCAYMYGKGCKPNTLRAYLAAIRALFNEAIKAKELDKDIYPFEAFKMPKKPRTKKRALRMGDINSIRDLELEHDSYLWKARNYFLFMFNNMGINFIDLVQLKKSQFSQTEYDKNGRLIAGRIKYAREKTDGEFSIKLTQESLEILNHYNIKSKKKNDFIFPYGYENTEEGRKRYEQHRKTVNGHLKQIAELAGIDENMTTYFARHTWATTAKRNHYPTTLIKDALGHADLKTTESYLASFDNDELDTANEAITQG